MLFMYIHTHTAETCNIDKPQDALKLFSQILSEAEKAKIKITPYGAPHEHTMYAIVEANDIAVLEKILTPLTKWGEASLIPIMSYEQGAATFTPK
jgi:hypothetical protein